MPTFLSSCIFFRSEEIESFHGTLQEELNLSSVVQLYGTYDGHIDLLLFHLKSNFDKGSMLHLILNVQPEFRTLIEPTLITR